MKSVADAKKAGVDTHLSEQEIRNKQVQQKRDEFELNYVRHLVSLNLFLILLMLISRFFLLKIVMI